MSPPGRVGRGLLAEEVQKVGQAVVEAGKAQAEDEDIAAEAPEEFLDPIMSHLMTDPVILPSSKVCIALKITFTTEVYKMIVVDWGGHHPSI